MTEFLGVFWPHLKVLEKLGKDLFSRASSVKYKPLNYVFIRPVDKYQLHGNVRVKNFFTPPKIFNPPSWMQTGLFGCLIQ